MTAPEPATATVLGVPTGEREQARWAARGLLHDLQALDPELAARRRAQLEALGMRWLTLAPVDEAPGVPVKVAEAALALGVRKSRIYGWRSTGLVSALPGGVLLDECRAVLARQDRPVDLGEAV